MQNLRLNCNITLPEKPLDQNIEKIETENRTRITRSVGMTTQSNSKSFDVGQCYDLTRVSNLFGGRTNIEIA